jgi:hypothetical protein
MEFLTKIDLQKAPVLKLIAMFALGMITVAVLGTFAQNTPLAQVLHTKSGVSEDLYYAGNGGAMPELSVRNVMDIMPPIDPVYTPGNDAEAYEVKQYSVTIETRNRVADCADVRGLMQREEVIFESTSEHDRGCSYTFKVEKDSVESVLAILENLNPKYINENTYTIKREVSDYTSEIEILEKKLATFTETLTTSVATYDELIRTATARGDIDSLAQLTDSKINLVERITMSQIQVSAELDRINRAKTEALDQLVYTQFYVEVYENSFVNGDDIKDSWIVAVQQLIRDINTFVQEVSLGFIALLFMIAKFALYGVVLLFVARFGWNFVRQVWRGEAK